MKIYKINLHIDTGVYHEYKVCVVIDCSKESAMQRAVIYAGKKYKAEDVEIEHVKEISEGEVVIL